MECVSDIALGKWLSGTLPPAQQAQLSAHVDECAGCREIWAAVVRAGPDAEPVASQAASIATANLRYVLHEELVRGGMGRILRAHDRGLSRDVAIKCLRDDRGDPSRFAQEIAILSKLSHPAIVAIYDSGWLAPGFPYFAMPLLQGETLAQHVRRDSTIAQRVALVRRLLPVVNAVAYAHSQAVLHRDIKPQNIFLGLFDECVLLDWGLATQIDHTRDVAVPAARLSTGKSPAFNPTTVNGLTHAGHGMGTPGFSAPEQLAGQPVEQRADVYALGAVLYYVLTGTPPASPHAQDVRTLAPDVPRDLAAVVMHAVAPAPGDRYASALDLANELERFFAGLLVNAHHYMPSEIMWRWVKSHRAIVAVATLATFAVLASVTVAWFKITHQRDVAIAERTKAVAARRKTQALSSFVLVDVQEKFDQLGRLDLMNDLAHAAAQYLADPAQPSAGMTPADVVTEQLNQARLQQMLGDVAQFGAHYQTALQHYQQGYALVQQAITDGDPHIELRCRSLLRVGDAQRSLGDATAAIASYRACLTLAGDISTVIAQRRPDWAMLLDAVTNAHTAVADVERERNALAPAIAGYQQALAALKPTVARDNPQQRKRTAVLHVGLLLRIANTYKMQNNYDLAGPAIAAALATSEQLVATLPRDIDVQAARATVLTTAAQLRAEVGNLAGVPALLTQAAAIVERLAGNDPSNVTLARQLGLIWQLQGEIAEPAQRGVLLGKATALSRKLLANAPDSPPEMLNFISDGVGLMDWLVEHAQLPPAKALCDEATTVARARRAKLPAGSGETELLIALLHCADVDDALQRPAEAQRKRFEAVQLANQGVVDKPEINTRYWRMSSVLYWLGAMPVNDARAHIDALTTAVQAVASDPATEQSTAEVKDANALLARLKKPR